MFVVEARYNFALILEISVQKSLSVTSTVDDAQTKEFSFNVSVVRSSVCAESVGAELAEMVVNVLQVAESVKAVFP